MAGDPQKTPLAQTLNAFAGTKAAEAIARLGHELPCHVTAVAGQIVTVAFDVAQTGATIPPVTVPIATSKYDWVPVQIGDRGYCAAASVYLGGVSGLGGGTASLTQPGNLTALVYVPVSNKGWTVPDADQRVVQGPAGVLLQDMGAGAIVNIGTDEISLSVGAVSLVINSSAVIIQGRTFLAHEHTGVMPGSSDTGGVV